jgi:hypothetical protein
MMRAVTDNRYRMAFLLLGLALAAVIAATVLLAPSGRLTDLPEAVEAVAPADGSTVQRQTDLVVDMQVGYTVQLWIDGLAIPQDEIAAVEPTGVHTWTPGPGQSFEEWTPGLHGVLVRYEGASGATPDLGEVRWVFTVQ